MGSWNMPPGVSVNDIPGNRPEDLAEDRRNEELADKLLQEGWSQAQVDELFEDEHLFSAIVAAQVLSYNEGFDVGRAEAGMDMHLEEEERQESEAREHGIGPEVFPGDTEG